MTVDRIIAAVTLLLAVIYLYATTKIPALEIGDPLGPKAFPVLLGIALIVAAIALFIETRKKQDALPAAVARGNPRYVWMIVGVTVWTALYFWVFERAGFLAATLVFLLVLMAVFNRGKWRANVLTAVLFALGGYILFVKILGVNLPRGMPPFDLLASAIDMVWTFAASGIAGLRGR